MNRANFGGISVGGLLLIAAVAVGLAFLIVPMLPDNRPMDIEKNFAENSESHRRLLADAAEVDQACRAGDLALLESLLSERYLAELTRGLTGDQDLAGLLGAQREGMVGDLSGEEFVLGSAGMGRAFMIYRSERPDPVLRAFVFYWTGQRFQLDGRGTQRKKTWSMPDAKAQAAMWGLNFLRGR